MNIRNLTAVYGLLLLPFAQAYDQVCKESDGVHYKSCDNQLGWYIGTDIGFASTDISSNNLDNFYQASGVSANSIDIDDTDMAFSVFGGYQFSSYFAVEGGYVDLGERSVTFTGEGTDIASFYDNAEHVYPQSGKGLSVTLVGSLPLSESFKVSAKLGYFDWKGNYNTAEQSTNVGSDTISGGDIWFGGEINYRVDDDIQVYVSAQRFELSRDTTTNIALGIRYYFGGESESRKSVKVKQLAAQRHPIKEEKPQPVAVILDSDKDGIVDSVDSCPDSIPLHQVDVEGCTKMEMQVFSFNLTIYYERDSSEIPQEYQGKIAELATFIKHNEVKTLKVYGHASAPGTRSYNQGLSQKRAESVGKVLAEQFTIDSQIIVPIGKGETELVNTANTEAAHNVNRRIELRITERLVSPVKK
jgi:OOP family OmpA-OmpF porin